MTPQTATVIITAPFPQVYDYLANPRNLRRYLCGAVPVPDDARARTAPAARWTFYAEGTTHRVHWQLVAPHRAHGVLDVYGDCSLTQLWLTVLDAPRGWPAGQLRAIMRAVLYRIREQIENDPTRNGRHALLRSA